MRLGKTYRYLLIYRPNLKVFPQTYRHRFVSLFKKAHEISGLEYFEGKPKPYTFSLRISAIAKPDYLILNNNKIGLLISCISPEYLSALVEGLSQIEEFSLYPELKIFLESIKPLKIPKIHEGMLFRTLAPVSIEKNNKPVLPWDKNFHEVFNEVHEKIFALLGLKYKEVKLFFKDFKKVVVKHTFLEFRKSTKKEYMYLTCFLGNFRMFGDEETIRLLYLNGVGLRTSEGFGFLKV